MTSATIAGTNEWTAIATRTGSSTRGKTPAGGHRDLRRGSADRERSQRFRRHVMLEAYRMHYTQRRAFRVLCVGCGAVADIRELLTQADVARWAAFDVVDSDADAVAAARADLAQAVSRVNNPATVRITHHFPEQILHLAEQDAGQDHPPYDWVYFADEFRALDNGT